MVFPTARRISWPAGERAPRCFGILVGHCQPVTRRTCCGCATSSSLRARIAPNLLLSDKCRLGVLTISATSARSPPIKIQRQENEDPLYYNVAAATSSILLLARRCNELAVHRIIVLCLGGHVCRAPPSGKEALNLKITPPFPAIAHRVTYSDRALDLCWQQILCLSYILCRARHYSLIHERVWTNDFADLFFILTCKNKFGNTK